VALRPRSCTVRFAIKSADHRRRPGPFTRAGKKLFVERCAKCHDERGDKPLKAGLPLSQRELSGEQLARIVSGRLKDSPDEDKRAVTLYLSTLFTKK